MIYLVNYYPHFLSVDYTRVKCQIASTGPIMEYFFMVDGFFLFNLMCIIHMSDLVSAVGCKSIHIHALL